MRETSPDSAFDDLRQRILRRAEATDNPSALREIIHILVGLVEFGDSFIAEQEGDLAGSTTSRVLRPKAEKAIVEGLLAELAPRAVAKDAGRRRKELATLDLEIARLTEAIAMGGQLTSLVEALSTRTARRRTLAADVQETDVSRLDPAGLGQRVRDRFAAWRTDLAGPLPTKRKLLREILTGPLLLTPGERAYTFEGEIAAERLLTGEIGLPTNLARPAGLEPATLGLEGRCSIH